ncbi:MAG: YihA family ribosome biogenesis GTP-binding protein [Succinivibrio sp.]|nr:YihA family ribosome biogenesis GTP-binding protein [Succinivibrio sp.]
MSEPRQILFQKAHFLLSAPDMSTLPSDEGAEIAFIGRSNSGKSTSLNAICQQKKLAKTSATPGRTRMINLFEIEPGLRLADLPGYGYAAVPESMKRKWQKAMSDYLQQRRCLKGLVVTMDIRTPLKEHDRVVLDWSIAAELPALLLLTKADKLGTNARRNATEQVRTMLDEFDGTFTIIPFSAPQKIGIDEARAVLSAWFNAR